MSISTLKNTPETYAKHICLFPPCSTSAEPPPFLTYYYLSCLRPFEAALRRCIDLEVYFDSKGSFLGMRNMCGNSCTEFVAKQILRMIEDREHRSIVPYVSDKGPCEWGTAALALYKASL